MHGSYCKHYSYVFLAKFLHVHYKPNNLWGCAPHIQAGSAVHRNQLFSCPLFIRSQICHAKYRLYMEAQSKITDILGCAKHKTGQLYHCCSFVTKQDMCTTYKSWICPTLQNMVVFFIQVLLILHARHLEDFSHCPNAEIMGLVCHLLAVEGCTCLLPTCSFVVIMQAHHRFHRLHPWDPAEHFCFVNPCNFRALDRFKRR